MNNEILVVFQCEKWFVYQTTWFKVRLSKKKKSENWCKFLLSKMSTVILQRLDVLWGTKQIQWPWVQEVQFCCKIMFWLMNWLILIAKEFLSVLFMLRELELLDILKLPMTSPNTARYNNMANFEIGDSILELELHKKIITVYH